MQLPKIIQAVGKGTLADRKGVTCSIHLASDPISTLSHFQSGASMNAAVVQHYKGIPLFPDVPHLV